MSNIVEFKPKSKITTTMVNFQLLHSKIMLGGIHMDFKHVLELLEYDEDIQEAIDYLKCAMCNVENEIDNLAK